jgi:8-oxo-dGTP pyrophosphatase MutT (NUDIX family)
MLIVSSEHRQSAAAAVATVADVAAADSPTIDRAALATRVAVFERREHPLDGAKPAAVAVVVIGEPRDDTEYGVLLTKRAPRMRAHAGQWALPGGRLDADETAADAARRELHEELGLELGADSVLGLLDDYPTRSGYRITPVVMWLAGGIDDLSPNPHEVASVHVATWDMLGVEPVFLTIPESERPVIQLPMLGTRIHAPTAAVLYQFRELALFARTTRVDELEQPTWAWR